MEKTVINEQFDFIVKELQSAKEHFNIGFDILVHENKKDISWGSDYIRWNVYFEMWVFYSFSCRRVGSPPQIIHSAIKSQLDKALDIWIEMRTDAEWEALPNHPHDE
jgi:hypothetical protein